MFIELLRKRRSIRQFTDEKVEKEKIDLLIEAMLRAPSSRSLNPWEFVVVAESATIEELSRCKAHGSTFMKNAPLAIVVVADPAKSDVWVEDCSIATLNLHYAAADLGLGSCWVQVRLRSREDGVTAEEHVKRVLHLEDDMVVEAIVAIGYPKEEKTGQPVDSLLFDRVSYEQYSHKN